MMKSENLEVSNNSIAEDLSDEYEEVSAESFEKESNDLGEEIVKYQKFRFKFLHAGAFIAAVVAFYLGGIFSGILFAVAGILLLPKVLKKFEVSTGKKSTILVVLAIVLAILAVIFAPETEEVNEEEYFSLGDTVSMIQNDGQGEFTLTFTEYGTVEEYGEISTYIEYRVENVGSESIYFNDAEIYCYADGYSVNTDYVINGNYNNNVDLSPGRSVVGEIYFDVDYNLVDSLQLEYADAIWNIK